MAEQIGFDLVPTALAVEAMRDNGYKNAAYAAAELIDNSLQAGATAVELLVREEVQMFENRTNPFCESTWRSWEFRKASFPRRAR